jgi:hypothetical protein
MIAAAQENLIAPFTIAGTGTLPKAFFWPIYGGLQLTKLNANLILLQEVPELHQRSLQNLCKGKPYI